MIDVLVVDDSALVRQALREILERTGEFVVTTAPDAAIAERRIAALRPDVIVLDIEMPGMDGLTFLTRLMSRDPIPVVICSARVGDAASIVLDALARGAVDVLSKPRVGVRGFLDDSATLFADTIRAAALSRAHAGARTPAQRLSPPGAYRGGNPWLVALGASTGGTEALASILAALPAQSPGLVIAQHMPGGFTRAFARRLDGLSALTVREAEDGDTVAPGLALVAPGGRHLTVRAHGTRFTAHVDESEPVNRHRPSVDVLFRSVAAAAGPHSVGVLLTGMGRDGAAGLLEMRRSGARTIAQDEDSSVVYGMPREAVILGAAQQVLPLSAMTSGILEALPSA